MCLRIASPAISRVGSGGMAGFVGVDRAEPLLEDLAELCQRMSDVDDLVEPRPEEIVLPAVPPLFRPHEST